jgi:hypothetical protein
VPFDPVRSAKLSFQVPQRLDATGVTGPTRNQAKRSRWRSAGPGLYLPEDVDPDRPEQRVVTAAARYPGAVVSGWGALWFHGAAYFDGLASDGSTPLPLVLVLPSGNGRRAAAGTRLSYEPCPRDEVTEVEGVRVMRPTRALFDEVRATKGERERVVAVDMAAAARLVAPEHLAAHAASHTRWRRSGVVQPAIALASELSRSPNETRLRLVWRLDAGLPEPLVNQDVFDRAGRFVCTADLFDPVAGLVVEFDGAEHRTRRRHTKDVARQDRCRALGLEYAIITGTDLHDTALVVERLTSTRVRARFADPQQAAWTLQPPPHWTVCSTWADERALHAWTREQMVAETRAPGQD